MTGKKSIFFPVHFPLNDKFQFVKAPVGKKTRKIYFDFLQHQKQEKK
jgi:hypothetical protein